MNIGKSLKVALVKRDMTQTDLAKKMNVHLQWVNKLANSDSASQASIMGLAEALDMKVSEFIALGEDME